MPPSQTPLIRNDQQLDFFKTSSFSLDFPTSTSKHTTTREYEYYLEIVVSCYVILVIVFVGMLLFSFIARHIRLKRIRQTPGGGAALQSSLESVIDLNDLEAGLLPGSMTETVPLSPSLRARIFANALRQPEKDKSPQDELQTSTSSANHLQVPVPVGIGGDFRCLSNPSIKLSPSPSPQSLEERWNITQSIDEIVEENETSIQVLPQRIYSQMRPSPAPSPRVGRVPIGAAASPHLSKKPSIRLSGSSMSENGNSVAGSSQYPTGGAAARLNYVLPFSFFHSTSSPAGNAGSNRKVATSEKAYTTRSLRSHFMEGSMFDSEANTAASQKDKRRTKSVFVSTEGHRQSVVKFQTLKSDYGK